MDIKHDLRIALDVFITLVFMETVAKPVAVRLGRFILFRVDRIIKIIPDWLYKRKR